MQMLSMVLLFSCGTVFISGGVGPDEGCSSYDLPEFSRWVEEGCDENEEKFECAEGSKMTVSTTCKLGKWTETVQCVLEENLCETNPCLNNGTCRNGLNNYTCECAGQWKGDNCESCSNFIPKYIRGYVVSQPDLGTQNVSLGDCKTLCADNPQCISLKAIDFKDYDQQCFLYSKPISEMYKGTIDVTNIKEIYLYEKTC